LSYAIFAITKLKLKITRPIFQYLLGFGWQNIMQGKVTDVI